jgi:Zn-dependent protease with chaperone function
MFDPKLRAPREKNLFVLGVIFSSLIWLVLVVTVFGMVYGLFIGLAVLVAHALFLAHVRGNAVRLSEEQVPELYGRARAAAERLGLREMPEVYVLQAGGLLNAFATKLLSRKYVILYSDLIDNCQDPRQLDFVVGHEMGHLAAGHLAWNLFLAPFRLVPWLAPAYSRACEYTSDRCGYFVAGDLEQSMRGLVVLAAGGKIAERANLAAFEEQLKETGGFWMAVSELSASHPFLCKRVAALRALTDPSTLVTVPRNPFAWLLAPALGAASGGSAAGSMMMVVAIMGILAAIAIPNFIRYQERARQAALGQPNGSASAAATSEEVVPPAGAALTADDRATLEWIKQVRQQAKKQAGGK